MQEGTLVEVVSPMLTIPAMVLEGKYLDLKTGIECSHAGCIVYEVGRVIDLSEEDWKSLDETMKVGWTEESRASAAAVRGAKPGA